MPPLALGFELTEVAVGDVDGDGRADVVAVDGMDASYYVMLGNGDGTFGSPIVTSLGALSYNGWSLNRERVRIADFDTDGRPDLAVGGLNNGVILVPAFGSPGTYPIQELEWGSITFDLTVADVTGDGLPDLISTLGSVDGGDGVVALDRFEIAFNTP